MATAKYELLRKMAYKSSDLLVEIDRFENGQNLIRLAFQDRVLDSYHFYGLIQNITGMNERLPVDTKFKYQGDATLEILNERVPGQAVPAKFSDLLNDWLVGAKVIIYQYFEGMAYSDLDDDTIMYAGWINGTRLEYDTQIIHLTVSPYKHYPNLPILRMHEIDYDNPEEGKDDTIMPIIWGENYFNNRPKNAVDDLDDLYGGAFLLPCWCDYDVPSGHYRYLTAGHVGTSTAVSRLYSNTTLEASYWAVHNDNAGGPSWRNILTVEVMDEIADTTKDWSVDCTGLQVSGVSVKDPITSLREILVQILGLNWQGTGWCEIDNTTAQLTFDNLYTWPGAVGLYSAGIEDQEITMEQLFSNFMGQFPFWIYRGRNGKFYFKKWARMPDVDYTERALSFEDDITDIQVEMSNPTGPVVEMNYWPNHGRSEANEIASGGYFARAFINLYVQDSGYTLDEDLDTTETVWDITGSGTFPTTGNLVMVGRETCEVQLPGTPTGSTITVWRRAGNGTEAVEHSTGDKIYILRPDSAAGRNNGVQGGNIESTAQYIEIWEDATHYATLDLTSGGGSNHPKLYRDAVRLIEHIASRGTINPSLQGTFTGTWNPETGFYTLSSTVAFKILMGNSDNLVKVLGWWGDTDLATSQIGNKPARRRESQLTYDYAVRRRLDTIRFNADYITGSGIPYWVGGMWGGDLTPIEACAYRFDIGHRAMRRVRFRAPLHFVNLTIGKIFSFASDIDEHIKVHGESWTNLNWRVIETWRATPTLLGFIAEEAT